MNFSGWIGMFTGGTIWILTHGHVAPVEQIQPPPGEKSHLLHNWNPHSLVRDHNRPLVGLGVRQVVSRALAVTQWL